jgi:hypothetical protein
MTEQPIQAELEFELPVHSFEKDLAASQGVKVNGDVKKILLEQFPGAVDVTKSETAEDKHGVDYWVHLDNGKRLSVDLKSRNDDPVEKFGEDDVTLEVSSVSGKKVGWTLDGNKQCDFILFFFKPTKRFILLPFPQLLAVAKSNMETWKRKYTVWPQKSVFNDGNSWTSEHIYLPRDELLDAIKRRYHGEPNG